MNYRTVAFAVAVLLTAVFLVPGLLYGAAFPQLLQEDNAALGNSAILHGDSEVTIKITD